MKDVMAHLQARYDQAKKEFDTIAIMFAVGNKEAGEAYTAALQRMLDAYQDLTVYAARGDA